MGDGRDGRAEWRHCWVCCEPVFSLHDSDCFLLGDTTYKLCPADLQNPYSFLMLAPKYYSDLFAYFPHILISKKQNASERIKILSTFKVYRIFRETRIEAVELKRWNRHQHKPFVVFISSIHSFPLLFEISLSTRKCFYSTSLLW